MWNGNPGNRDADLRFTGNEMSAAVRGYCRNQTNEKQYSQPGKENPDSLSDANQIPSYYNSYITEVKSGQALCSDDVPRLPTLHYLSCNEPCPHARKMHEAMMQAPSSA